MRLLIAAALVAAFFVAGPPWGGAAACETPAKVTAGLVARYPETSLRERLAGVSARRFVARYNAVPPATEHGADEVLIFQDRNFPRARLVQLFIGGCLAGGGVLAAPLVDWLLSEIGAET